MKSPLDNEKKFTTLLVHANYSLPTIDSILVLADTEHEAAILLDNKIFNLVILDIDLNGASLITIAKNSSNTNCNTPIIALVNSNDPEQRKQLIAAGFDDCLIKPLTDTQLYDCISFWCENDDSTSLFESMQTLLTKFKGNKALVLKLYMKLFEELPQQIEQIKTALKNDQFQQAFDTTHKINASAKIFYLNSMEDLAKALEACLKQERYDLAEVYFSMLQQNINTLIKLRHSILGYLVE